MKRKFKHRKVIDYRLICFNRLFDSLVKSLVKAGLSIECLGLIDCKPMIPDDDLFKFIKKKHPYKLIPNVEKTYEQRAEEYCRPVVLENFTLKINEKAVKMFLKMIIEGRENSVV